MSNYSQTTFFGPKDALASGNPNKKILGAQLDTELAALGTAVATKLDSVPFAAAYVDSGVANAILINLPSGSAFSAYTTLAVKIAASNTAAATFQVQVNGNSQGVKNITFNGAALAGGELLIGKIYQFAYDGTNMQLVAPLPSAPYQRTAAEIAASVVPTTLVYAPGNVLRYGADNTGATDSTAAWNSALAQRVNGGEEIRFPGGLYKGNYVATGQNIVVNLQEPYYEDVQTVGFIANNAALPVWSIGDGSTLTSSVMFRGGLKMHGNATAQKGILFNGVQNCWIDNLIARGFTTYGVSYTASTTRPSSYVFINSYRIDVPAGAGSGIALVVTQPANYPTSYATAFYLNGGAIQSNTGTLWAVQINANSTIYVSNSYWTMGNNVGINFADAAGTGQIICDNLMIDTLGTNADVLVTCAANLPLANNIYGFVTINGKCSINGLVSGAALAGSGYLGHRTFCLNPSVVGSLDFQDSSANKADQQVYATQAMTLSRSGSNFFLKNTAGPIIAQGSSLELTNGAGSADAPVLFGITNIKILTGAGAPAVSAPVGSLYLRSDGGAVTTLYVKESGTGTSGWVAK